MFVITGVTGKVGGVLAHTLLAQGLPVRAVVRDARKGNDWEARGCEVAVADMQDSDALAHAFAGATAVFILPPSDFDPDPGYPQARTVISAVVRALTTAMPDKILCLSSIGADAAQDNLLTQRTLMEAALSTLPIPVTFLRPGWFLENSAWDVASARDEGIIRSFLMPLDKAFPMVATKDVGWLAAGLIQEEWSGTRIVELEGPQRISPNDLAAAFARALGSPVHAEVVPPETWEDLFRSQGMKNPHPRINMLQGFNAGWIEFSHGGASAIKGGTALDEVIATLLHKSD